VLHLLAPFPDFSQLAPLDSESKTRKVPKLSETKGGRPGFNSGKWLQIPSDFKGFRTSSEQMKLPAWSIQEGKGNLEIRFRWGKKHKAISSGTKSHREAEASAPALLMAWIRSKGKEAVEHPFQAAAAEFIAEQYADHKGDTRSEVDLVLRRLAGAFPGVSSVGELTPKVFKAGAGKLRGEASPKYWANILSIVRKFFRWCVDNGYMAVDPSEGIPFPKKSTFGRGKEIWAEGYFEKVCEVVSEFDLECLMVMRWSGMDSGDLATFEPKKHLVRDSKGALIIKKRREKAKSEEETVIQPVSSKIEALLLKRLKSGEGYGAGYASVRSFTASLRKRVQSSMERAGLPIRDLKSLRHSFATYHAERDVPLDVLRRWMGHADDSRTLDRYYVHRASTARFMD
jgi:integrase